jgi:hypothetical protein
MGRATHSTTKKQEEGEKQNLAGQGIWEAASGNYEPASVNTSHSPKKK